MRYFFDSFDGQRFIADEDGVEFSRIALVRDAAISALADIGRDTLSSQDRQQSWIQVRDADGALMLKATMTVEVVWVGNYIQ
jgi:hypothetical protein